MRPCPNGDEMDPQTRTQAERDYSKARTALAKGNVLAALSLLESAIRHHDNPSWHSMLGYCMAKERGHVTKGVELCRSCLEREPENPDHYYFLGKIYILAKNRAEAFTVLRLGMSIGGSIEIQQLLNELGPRKRPFIPWLVRDHPINKYMGIFLSRIGLR